MWIEDIMHKIKLDRCQSFEDYGSYAKPVFVNHSLLCSDRYDPLILPSVSIRFPSTKTDAGPNTTSRCFPLLDPPKEILLPRPTCAVPRIFSSCIESG